MVFSGMDPKRDEESYSEHEAAKQRDEVLKRMLNTPPEPHKSKERSTPKGRVRKGKSRS